MDTKACSANFRDGWMETGMSHSGLVYFLNMLTKVPSTGTDEIKELTVGNSPFVFNNYGAGLINTNNGSAVQYNSFGSGNMFNGPIYGLQLPSRRPH